MASGEQFSADTSGGEGIPLPLVIAEDSDMRCDTWEESGADWMDLLLDVDSLTPDALPCDAALTWPQTSSTVGCPPADLQHTQATVPQRPYIESQPTGLRSSESTSSCSRLIPPLSSAFQTSTTALPATMITEPRRIALTTTRQRLTRGGRSKSLSTIDRQKSEIRALREEAAELEELLKLLTRGWREENVALNDERTTLCEPKWQCAARRELGLLQASTDENRELRESVAHQRHLAKGLRRILAKRVAQIAVSAACYSCRISEVTTNVDATVCLLDVMPCRSSAT